MAAGLDSSTVEPGAYRHYKGKLYRVIGTAKHSETLEPLVIYEALYENAVSKLWARPLELFLGFVEVGGKKVRRFERVAD